MNRDPIGRARRLVLAGLELKAATVGLTFAERIAFDAYALRLEAIRAASDAPGA